MLERLVPTAFAITMLLLPAAASGQTHDAAHDHGTGPYPAMMEVDVSLPAHVLYRPANLQLAAGKRLGIVLWGNGACIDDGESARAHLMEIASYGYLVIAPGFPAEEAARRRSARGPQVPGAPLLVATRAADVGAGLDWALAENARQGSPYRGLIDPAAVAVAGHSCGGVQALELAADPRVAAVIVNNSGLFPDEGDHIAGMELPKSALGKLHTPVLYLMGGPTDIAWVNGTDDFRRIDNVPAMMVSLPVGHGGTFAEPNGGAAATISVDWLEWQLRRDQAAGRSFAGENCRICTVPEWSIERKGFEKR